MDSNAHVWPSTAGSWIDSEIRLILIQSFKRWLIPIPLHLVWRVEFYTNSVPSIRWYCLVRLTISRTRTIQFTTSYTYYKWSVLMPLTSWLSTNHWRVFWKNWTWRWRPPVPGISWLALATSYAKLPIFIWESTLLGAPTKNKFGRNPRNVECVHTSTIDSFLSSSVTFENFDSRGQSESQLLIPILGLSGFHETHTTRNSAILATTQINLCWWCWPNQIPSYKKQFVDLPLGKILSLGCC